MNERINLDEQLEETTGEINCPSKVKECVIRIILKDDNVCVFRIVFVINQLLDYVSAFRLLNLRVGFWLIFIKSVLEPGLKEVEDILTSL